MAAPASQRAGPQEAPQLGVKNEGGEKHIAEFGVTKTMVENFNSALPFALLDRAPAGPQVHHVALCSAVYLASGGSGGLAAAAPPTASNQASFSPFGPREISVLIELTIGHLREHQSLPAGRSVC